MATVRERDLFSSKVLSVVGRNASRLPASKVTGFLAMRGQLYDHELMIVGRAVNGWSPSILPSALASPAARESFADEVLASVVCPMRWVTNLWGEAYNTRRSAFWRTTRGVVGGLGIADVESAAWPSHLVWSNLYRVSPSEQGNPSTELGRVQLPGCIELLQLELDTYQPLRLLFLTGDDWAEPFLDAIGGEWQQPPELSPVQRFGTIQIKGDTTRCVVATHPQGKPERQWISEVVAAFDD